MAAALRLAAGFRESEGRRCLSAGSALLPTPPGPARVRGAVRLVPPAQSARPALRRLRRSLAASPGRPGRARSGAPAG